MSVPAVFLQNSKESDNSLHYLGNFLFFPTNNLKGGFSCLALGVLLDSLWLLEETLPAPHAAHLRLTVCVRVYLESKLIK